MNKIIFTSMFAENLRNDAQSVFRKMQLPTVLRLRAEANACADHPLLSLRMDLMEKRRDQLKNLAHGLLEGEPPLDTEAQLMQLGKDLLGAYQSCVRVLEVAEDKDIKARVAVCAKAMGGSMQLMASILSNQGHSVALDVHKESARAIDLSERVEEISYRLKVAYQQTREQLAQPGERIVPEPAVPLVPQIPSQPRG